ncbi:MAG: NRDE family protein [Flavobacteriales bacterium]
MCTVSFIANRFGIFITSNRDEDAHRAVHHKPVTDHVHGAQLTFPKDPKAGGTWFAINKNGCVAVLLNGAFVKHKHTGNYKRSRGLVLLEIAAAANALLHFDEMVLNEIEPFTVLLYYHQLHELRWDGRHKYKKNLDTNIAHIYSSSTLYSLEIVKHREELFKQFLFNNEEINEQSILQFHSNTNNDAANGFVMKRSQWLRTLSITQVVMTKQNAVMHHHDLLTGEHHEVRVGGMWQQTNH